MRTDRAIAIALLVGGAAVAITLGAQHRALLVAAPEASGSIEWDFYYSYVRDAQRLERWQPPLDEWRPPLYPILLALLHQLFSFASLLTIAKTMSSVANGAAVALTFLIARRVVSRDWAVLVALTTAVTPTFVLHGVLVGTDMLFAALCLAVTLVVLHALDGSRRAAIAAGVLAGLAWTMRWNAMFLVPAAIAALLLLGQKGARRAHALAFALACAATFTPWLVFNTWLHGEPFFSRSNVNLSIAIYGNQSSVQSIGGALAAAPGLILDRWLRNIAHNGSTIALMLAPLVFLAPIGAAIVWWRRGPAARPLAALVLMVGCLLAVNALGPFVPRQYLLMLPIALTCAAAAAHQLTTATRGRSLVASAVFAMLWLLAAMPILARSTDALAKMRAVEIRETTNAPPPPRHIWPLLGDWDGDGRDEPGVVLDAGGSLMFYGVNAFAAGPAHLIAAYGGTGAVPLVGRWRGGRLDTIAVSAPGVFFLKHAFFTGFADTTTAFGGAGQPLTGDWSGAGRSGLGLFADGAVSVVDDAIAPGAGRQFTFGGAGDIAVVGDWNGDGAETLGVYRDGVFTLTNRTSPPFVDAWRVDAGTHAAGAQPIAGDRLGIGRDVPVLFLPDGTFVFFEPTGPWSWRIDVTRLDDFLVAGR